MSTDASSRCAVAQRQRRGVGLVKAFGLAPHVIGQGLECTELKSCAGFGSSKSARSSIKGILMVAEQSF